MKQMIINKVFILKDGLCVVEARHNKTKVLKEFAGVYDDDLKAIFFNLEDNYTVVGYKQ